MKNKLHITLLLTGLLLLIGAVTPMRAHEGAGGINRANAAGDGPYLDSEIVVSSLDNEQLLPAVAYNWKHREYLVVWHNKWAGNRDIYAQRISDRGEVKSSFSISNMPFDRAQPSVAYDPVNDRYLVVWIYDTLGDGSDWDIMGRFVPWDGNDPNPSAFAISSWTTHQWNPQVIYARPHEEFLVVWTNEYQSGVLPTYVSGQRITAADGSFPDGAWTIATHATENRLRPDAAYNRARDEYLITYDNGVDIFGVRRTWNGVVLGGGEFGIAGWPDEEIRSSVAACSEADQYLVAWQSLVSGDYDLYARFIQGDGAPGNVYVISNYAGQQEEADVTCNLSNRQYMITWQEQITTYGISGRLVFPDETLGTGFQIAAPGTSPGHNNPAVAGGHTNYLVVWEHQRGVTVYRDIHGRLITPHGVFLPLVLR